MKKVLLFLISLLINGALYAQVYLAKTCEITFFSASVIENIDAKNLAAKPAMNTRTNEVFIKVPVRSFKFKSQMMEDHFNEDYMESDKFPFAAFSGKINEPIDDTKDTVEKVTVTGTMNMHGVDKPVTMEGLVTVKQGTIEISSKFKLRIADYNIKVPTLYVKNIAEEVEVTLNALLEPYKKS